MKNMIKELTILNKLGFEETKPLLFTFHDWERGTLFFDYKNDSLSRRSWAIGLDGKETKKENFEKYVLFKLALQENIQ